MFIKKTKMIDFYIPKFDIVDEPDYSGFIRTPDMAYTQPRPVYDNYINSVPSSDLYTNEDNVTGHIIDQELDRHINRILQDRANSIQRIPRHIARNNNRITGQYYAINRGDTLSDIARRSGISVEKLAALNGIKDINKIRAGVTLRLTGNAKLSNGVKEKNVNTGVNTNRKKDNTPKTNNTKQFDYLKRPDDYLKLKLPVQYKFAAVNGFDPNTYKPKPKQQNKKNTQDNIPTINRWLYGLKAKYDENNRKREQWYKREYGK